MVIAGHETVAAALAWTLMLLAEHQPAQDRVRAELAAHAGSGVRCSATGTTLPWTRAVVDEALRLFPPAWALSRRSQPGRRDRRARRSPPARWSSSARGCCTGAATRGPTRWPSGPERFLGAGATPPGYLPFGQGPRLCIGREFALGEMVVVLSRLLAALPGRRAAGLVPPGGRGAGRGAPARRHAARS